MVVWNPRSVIIRLNVLRGGGFHSFIFFICNKSSFNYDLNNNTMKGLTLI